MTPDWKNDTIPSWNGTRYVPVNYTYVAVAEMQINSNYTAESDFITFRGLTVEELDVVVAPAELTFTANGYLQFADKTKW